MTEYTDNYGLNKYSVGDAANLRDQYNASMDIIDSQLKTANDNAEYAKPILDAAGLTNSEAAAAAKTLWDTAATTSVQNSTSIDAINANLSALHASDVDSADDLYKKITSMVTPQMFGAAGNGSNDDTSAIQSAMDSGKSVYIPEGVYNISNTLIAKKNCCLFLSPRAVIKAISSMDSMLLTTCDNEVKRAFEKTSIVFGGTFDANNMAQNAIKISGYVLTVENCMITNFLNAGIIGGIEHVGNSDRKGGIWAINVYIAGNPNNTGTVGIDRGESTDEKIISVTCRDVDTGFKSQDGMYCNFHHWMSTQSGFDRSVMGSISGNVTVVNAFCDTVRTAFKTTVKVRGCNISNLRVWNNPVIISDNPGQCIIDDDYESRGNIENVVIDNADGIVLFKQEASAVYRWRTVNIEANDQFSGVQMPVSSNTTNPSIVAPGTDINDLKYPGEYYLNSSSYLNAPLGNSSNYGILSVKTMPNNAIFQRFASGAKIAVRRYENNTSSWTEWSVK